MNRKDFDAIAAVLNRNYQNTEDQVVVEAIAHDLADYLATTNDRFDRTRFMLAALNEDTKNLRAIVVEVKRLHNSASGCPTWQFRTLAGAVYRTRPNVSFSYEVSDRMEGQSWEFEMDSRNRIVNGREVTRGERRAASR